jgi:hypothetical protein
MSLMRTFPFRIGQSRARTYSVEVAAASFAGGAYTDASGAFFFSPAEEPRRV